MQWVFGIDPASAVESNYGVDQVHTKIFTFFVIAVFLILIIEPEGIEVYTYITMVFLVVLGTLLSLGFAYVIKNLTIYFENRGVPFRDIPKFKIKDLGEFTGNVAYAFEIASCYLSCRSD